MTQIAITGKAHSVQLVTENKMNAQDVKKPSCLSSSNIRQTVETGHRNENINNNDLLSTLSCFNKLKLLTINCSNVIHKLPAVISVRNNHLQFTLTVKDGSQGFTERPPSLFIVLKTE